MSAETTTSANPFSMRAALLLVLGGGALFVALLWMIGAGWSDGSVNDGGAHVGSRGLTGYSALADYLEARGIAVHRSQSKGALDSPGLVVLTPPAWTEGKEIERIVSHRRYIGATLIVTPKWQAYPANSRTTRNKDALKKTGWVFLDGTAPPEWKGFLDEVTVALGPVPGGQWRAAGLSGPLPQPKTVLSGQGSDVIPLVGDASGKRILAGYIGDAGYYPTLEPLALAPPPAEDDKDAEDDNAIFPLIVVFEPDLIDNYGMQNRASAVLAEKLVRAAANSGKGVTFDMTLNGHARSANLLTLAFTPPFLAPTLCLLLAALAAGWRTFLRFGPPRRTGRAIAFGKRALVANSAGLVARSGRNHLLAGPYGAAVRERLARALALPRQPSHEATDAAIDRVLARRRPDDPPFSVLLARLVRARRPHDLVKAAQDLHALERTLTK